MTTFVIRVFNDDNLMISFSITHIMLNAFKDIVIVISLLMDSDVRSCRSIHL